MESARQDRVLEFFLEMREQLVSLTVRYWEGGWRSNWAREGDLQPCNLHSLPAGPRPLFPLDGLAFSVVVCPQPSSSVLFASLKFPARGFAIRTSFTISFLSVLFNKYLILQ